MFKLESYIAPILLSYVSRYINNFKPEDSQVSLWGGDATFHNLELNLQVLEEELQLPFSFVSGSIRELLIHVPWTKITSEPITITINTIECILNLKGKDSASTRADHSPQAKEKGKKGTSHGKEVEPPQGYVQLLINKIVSNIRIYCNNVILKYVEEDIVLSMNIKLLKFESANDKWEPAYTDVSQAKVILRKVITVNDLTLCLDKRNASGKIEVYQEPMLYRCSMTMHLLRQYHSATVNRNSITRLDIYCNNMEFSMTEQQVPMLLRLLKLLYALQQKQLKPKRGMEGENSGTVHDAKDRIEGDETWTGWAWSYVSSVLAAPWDDDWVSEQQNNPTGHTLHFGFYVDTAIVTFKVSENNSERSAYYSHKKTRYNPMLCLQLQGIYSETIIYGLKWFNACGGISEAILLPKGSCSCSHQEVNDGDSVHYLKIGSLTNGYKCDSLFDADAVENKGEKRRYNTSWDYHMTVFSESVLLERTPAFAYDYLYQMEFPSDASSDILSDIGSDFEFSNLSERSSLRICLGPMRLRLCSGFFHRIATLNVAASYYDYTPYYTIPPDPPLQDLPPATEEDFDALNEYIPSRTVRITIFAPVIELELMDHPYFKPVKGFLFKKRKKSTISSTSSPSASVDLPKLSIECQFLDISIDYPMYINRLVYTTCQLPDAPSKLFDSCFTKQNIKVVGLCSRLVISPTSHTIILTPSSMSYNSNTILKPQYWTDPNITHHEVTFESEGLTLNATNAKMMVVAYIIMKTIRMDSEGAVNTMTNTSILLDASKDEDLPYMEFCIEEIRFRQVTTNSTVSIDTSLGSIKGFIFEPVDNHTKTKERKTNSRDLQQVLFVSGPEPKPVNSTEPIPKGASSDPLPLLTVTVQYPVRPDLQDHPPILLFNLQEIRICIDPLLCRWLLYSPKKLLEGKINLTESHIYKNKSISEISGSIAETPRKMSTQIESVHSSSDRELLKIPHKIQTPTIEEEVDLQEKIYNFLKKWFDVWKGVFLYGDLSQCTIYFPLVSLSAIGSQGIQEAVEAAVNKEHPPELMVITLPFANVRSAHRQSIVKFLKTLPIKLPNTIWSPDKSSFPWTMSISDLRCYTIQYGNKLTFLKPVSLSATVGLSTRVKPENNALDVGSSKLDISYLGVCVHIDMTPIVISTSEVQIYLFASILHGLVEVASNLFPEQVKHTPKSPDVQLPIVKGSSTLSPTLLKEHTIDSVSENTPQDLLSTQENVDDIKLTAWVQWTVTRFTMELLSSELKSLNDDELDSLQPRLKLVLDAEDIVSSLDFQSVYLKIKSKVGSASIQHYKRTTPSSKWKPGSFSGVVMRLREDISTTQHHEDSGFISVTITRASCQHTHTLWGAVQNRNKDHKKSNLTNHPMLSQSRYITEIVVNIQPIDFVLSLKTLRSFYLVIVPLLEIPINGEPKSASSNPLTLLNNQVLPLAYLECQDIRVIVPSADLTGSGAAHDVFILQIHKISLNPSAVNPICRNPIRSDIYEQAAHARILNIPGSEVEDRQYQLDLVGISVSTGIWEDVDYLFSHTGSGLSALRGTSENPAVEWNNLERGQPNITPFLNLWHVTEKFDISVIAAPAMVYKDVTLISGHSVEVNFVSDILVNVSLSQIKLFSALLGEFLLLIEPLAFEDGTSKRQKIKYPYSVLNSTGTASGKPNTSGKIIDSGIETSDLRSVMSSSQIKSLTENDRQFYPRLSTNILPGSYATVVPIEILVAAGKIAFGLFEVDESKPAVVAKIKTKKKKLHKALDDDLGYEAGEENLDSNDGYNKYNALIYFCLKQPNIFISKEQLGQRIQISCFDLTLKLSGPEYPALSQIPTEDDYPVNLLETRSGVPDSNTGILPAFFTMKISKNIGKSSTLNIDISKPTKILCSLPRWGFLFTVRDKVLESFKLTQKNLVVVSKSVATSPESLENLSPNHIELKTNDTYSKFRQLKEVMGGITSIYFNLSQIIFSIKTDSGYEVNFGMEKMNNQLTISNRPERLGLSCNLRCVTLTMIKDDIKRLILNPWSLSTNISLFWEAWQTSETEPQIQIITESDCLVIDISPEQIKAVEMFIKDVKEFLSILPFDEHSKNSIPLLEIPQNKLSTEKEQHYKDDLRAGAFQFVDAGTSENADELPLPYQVMFWNEPQISAMAWRYPQPRALTKVKVFPVPYKTSSQDDMIVLCQLEYWSEVRNCYLPFTQFQLSETEVCQLNLPESYPKPVVASAWRVVITVKQERSEDDSSESSISPRALAACMRIDSYFNKSLIPRVTAALYAIKIEMALHNYFEKNIDLKMPDCLKNYAPDFLYPETQRFLAFSIDNLVGHLSNWEQDTFSIELSSSANCNVLDYVFLTEQALIEPFSWRAEISVADSMRCHLITRPIEIKFGSSICHSLAVATQMWSTVKEKDNVFVIMTRYVVCNDTNVNIRFGQTDTDEDILLPSKHFHMYSWRSQKKKQQLKVAVEENNWIWSKSFTIFEDNTQTILFNSETNMVMFISVKSLSSTQKQIIISGQLIISNMLMEHFELKVVEAVPENRETEFKNTTTHIVPGRSRTASIFINNKKKYHLRLRFYGLDSAWTGDIPLREHANVSQPWLVKVPLQERGQFLSIWCRIVTQDFQKAKRILAMLWPLFSVKSNLPITSKVHIETPTLNVHLDSVVNGKGELQQLYCPGTIDHSHQLTFKIDKSDPKSNPYVPLNYSLVDHQTFFKKSSKENIDNILDVLSNCYETKWPYFEEELDGIDWIIEDQPLTHVQVRYHNACQYSSSLLVEVLPWSLTVNILGVPISFILNGTELCQIQDHGIIAPPKLEENFNIGVCLGGIWRYSGPLQLTKSDWSQSFHMPKFTGNIPLEGSIKTPVKFDSHICMLSITSKISNEIRLLKVSSTHILSNHLPMQIQVVCIAVPDIDETFDFPKDLETSCFTVPPHQQQSHSGISVIRWHTLKLHKDYSSEHALYMSFRLEPGSPWSCPLRVDKQFFRRSFCVYGRQEALSLVLTSHHHKGQTYVAMHRDDRPQLLFENKTDTVLFCAQSFGENEVAKEAQHFRWNFTLPKLGKTFYTMPLLQEKFPELPQNNVVEKFVLAVYLENAIELEWSPAINIIQDNELFVRIPYYGDVKVIILNTACTTFVALESASQEEISARDIRVRLSMRQDIHDALETTHSQCTEKEILNRTISDSSIHSKTRNVSPEYSNFIISETQSSANAETTVSPNVKTMIVPTLLKREKWEYVEIKTFFKALSIVFMSDLENEGQERWELASFVCDNVVCRAKQSEELNIKLSFSDMQFDNQLYTRESYDFPVVLIGQEKMQETKLISLNVPIESLLENTDENALAVVEFVFQSWVSQKDSPSITGIKTVKVVINPISCYIEDTYITRLVDYLKVLMPNRLVLWPMQTIPTKLNMPSGSVYVPEIISWQCAILAQPLTIRYLTVAPLSLLLSVHSSVKLYIALDQSPLHFGRFERRRLFTIPYKLGNASAMHYLSGAIFGAGWVVSSLELLGSPGGLARAMGTGLRDFVSMPYRGLIVGPMAFLKGITQGSASLMKHITAGTLQSVTKLASSVARNLDRLTLDEEHLRRTEEQRRHKPQGFAQGFMQGLTGLGISLLGAVGGIAHHPLQSVMADNASPRSLVTGVGLGLVGMVTKPLSGAAELVALTGQGLLQGAGWNSLPEPRASPTTYKTELFLNSALKYKWKHTSTLLPNQLLFVADATSVSNDYEFETVTLILTLDALIVISTVEDNPQKIISLSEINVSHGNDPTILTLKLSPPPIKTKSAEADGFIEMDPVSRARVANYVKNTVGHLNLPETVPSDAHSGISISPLSTPDLDETRRETTILTFFVNPQNRNYFLCLLGLAKHQHQNHNFPVL